MTVSTSIAIITSLTVNEEKKNEAEKTRDKRTQLTENTVATGNCIISIGTVYYRFLALCKTKLKIKQKTEMELKETLPAQNSRLVRINIVKVFISKCSVLPKSL